MVNHDAPHQPRSRCDKVGPALPDRLRIIDQPQIGFVENGGGLQGVAGALPAHVMVREPVQFGLHQREQLLQRFVVSAAPVAEQLGDLLSRRRGRRHTGCSTPQILTQSRDFYSTTGGDQKNCAVVAGFKQPVSFTSMTGKNNRSPKIQKRKQNPFHESIEPFQTDKSTTSDLRCAASRATAAYRRAAYDT